MNAYQSLRIATPDDEAILTPLIAASYARLADGYEPAVFERALPLMARANPKLLASGTYYVVFCHREPAGCGGWSFAMPGGGATIPGVAHIRHFASHPDHQRKGVARLLLRHCLAEAHREGATTMVAWSTLPGEAFYASMGFVTQRPVDVVLAPGVVLPSVEMERPLP